jgi:hypothetical protein
VSPMSISVDKLTFSEYICQDNHMIFSFSPCMSGEVPYIIIEDSTFKHISFNDEGVIIFLIA